MEGNVADNENDFKEAEYGVDIVGAVLVVEIVGNDGDEEAGIEDGGDQNSQLIAIWQFFLFESAFDEASQKLENGGAHQIDDKAELVKLKVGMRREDGQNDEPYDLDAVDLKGQKLDAPQAKQTAVLALVQRGHILHGVDGGKVFVERAVELFGEYEAEWTVQADAKYPEDVGAKVEADGRADRRQQIICLAMCSSDSSEIDSKRVDETVEEAQKRQH